MCAFVFACNTATTFFLTPYFSMRRSHKVCVQLFPSTCPTDGRGAPCGARWECDVDGLPYVIAGVKRWLMKLKSRDIYSGTRPRSLQIPRILSVVYFVLLSILRRVILEASPPLVLVSTRGHACRLKPPFIPPLTYSALAALYTGPGSCNANKSSF